MPLSSTEIKKYAIALALLASGYGATAQSKYDAQVAQLLKQMTLEEKVGQMAQITLDALAKPVPKNQPKAFELDPAKVEDAVGKYYLGSILNASNNRAKTKEEWFSVISTLQDRALKTRLKIPIIYGIDAIHGATYTAGATMFPQQINQAASFNRSLVKRAAQVTAYEVRASNTPWVFSPLLDLGADPRSPRQWESFGEDPYLDGQLGYQAVKGFEGDNNDADNPEHVVSSIKHYLGYQVPLSGKDRTPAFISDQALREYHLPPFKLGVEAGSHAVMVNSSIINNIPVHSNKKLLTDLLKTELGFKGLVVTDWGDIDNLYKRDHIASSEKEAIMIAINAGVDMSMIAYDYKTFCDDLIALVKEGKVKQARIDNAVARILKVKYAAGLFTRPNTDYHDYPKFGSKEFEQAAYNTAAESITLLKNTDNVLPLKKGVKVLVTGPNANSMRALNGAWTYSWQGNLTEEFAGQYNTILEALQNKAGKENINYVPGVSYKNDGKYWEEYPDKMEDAADAATRADVVVLCLGENSYTETPGNLNDLRISDLQIQLAKKVMASGKPVILVLNEGRPRVISEFAEGAKAIVQTFLPGNFGGDALVDILYGDVNPSGKLPYTYPRYANAIITYYHKPAEERATMEGAYNYEADYNPQFKFGDGLSYTTFKYSNLKLSSPTLSAGQTLTVTVDVTNTGQREGKEAVLLFSSDLVASITPDVKRLRGFDKIDLQPGQTKTVTFKLTPNDLAFVNADLKTVTEPGEFKIMAGDQTAQLIFK
ncbi:beta-glucosidase [Mucilaginibacter yixingensis]|uniref:beta-glucosidase n=1 Tax=Mucilaginibacter yixingensis TaxID=1295612 RepID=A0A2T5J732_9SPHI|nr:glycoside hydrolase family 3 N-terminal domain-containing protein [Mucilaginibacter yixingensis]PTQ94876.1 beta-glucosidase [Mucilaginibacter yixingensis]